MNSNKSIINPFGKIENGSINIALSCYTERLINQAVEKYDGKKIGTLSKTDIYMIKYNKKELIIFKSPIGAPWATMVLEDLISCGIKKVIYFGSCGILGNAKEFDILIPTKAMREEGTSYHYNKYGKIVKFNKDFIEDFEAYLNKNNISYKESFVWTTDAPYRETINKVNKYTKKGIDCVDMETSALQTIAKYRNIKLINYFYAADCLKNGSWDKRCLGSKDEKIMFLFESALKYLSFEE